MRRSSSTQPSGLSVAPTELVSHHARHALTRRAFMGSMASVAGAAMGVGLLPTTVLAKHPSSAPKPSANAITLNGNYVPLHVLWSQHRSLVDCRLPKGVVGVADVQGTGTATNPDGSKRRFYSTLTCAS